MYCNDILKSLEHYNYTCTVCILDKQVLQVELHVAIVHYFVYAMLFVVLLPFWSSTLCAVIIMITDSYPSQKWNQTIFPSSLSLDTVIVNGETHYDS